MKIESPFNICTNGQEECRQNMEVPREAEETQGGPPTFPHQNNQQITLPTLTLSPNLSLRIPKMYKSRTRKGREFSLSSKFSIEKVNLRRNEKPLHFIYRRFRYKQTANEEEEEDGSSSLLQNLLTRQLMHKPYHWSKPPRDAAPEPPPAAAAAAAASSCCAAASPC